MASEFYHAAALFVLCSDLVCGTYLIPFDAEVSGHYLLSERFSQDPVENYFGRQRAAGG